MARASDDSARKHKQARQKKLVLVLTPVLLGVLALQAPKLLAAVGGDASSSAAPPAATESASGETPPGASATASDADGTANASAGAPAGSTASPAPPPSLLDTDSPPPSDAFHLVTFTRFRAKNPFERSFTAAEASDAGASAGTAEATSDANASDSSAQTDESAPGSAGASSGADSSRLSPSPAEDEAPNAARISTNRKAETVAVDETFPAHDPIFRLVSVKAGAARVALTGGSFSTGQSTVTLRKGHRLVLVSEPGGARYRLELVGVGRVAVG